MMLGDRRLRFSELECTHFLSLAHNIRLSEIQKNKCVQNYKLYYLINIINR